MTYDYTSYDKQQKDLKPCEVCKCLTCASGPLWSGTCKYGVNCEMCRKRSYENKHTDCDSYKTGFTG